MIDIHCHLLPGIDDGARTLAEALEMARAAVKNGIQHAVMTPHLHPGRYENNRASIATALAEFQVALDKENIPLKCGAAAEVRLSPEILQMMEQDELVFLGEMDGYKILLLEFPHSHIPLGADNLARKLLDNKIRPIIAHPERNRDVINDLGKIQLFLEMGCLLQLTASAVAGRFGARPHQCARQLLELGAVTVLASDAHNLKGRTPELREGMEAAAEIVGAEAAQALVDKNPRAIVGLTAATPG